MNVKNMIECPKCALEAKSLLHRFCTHKECPVRDALGPYRKVEVCAHCGGPRDVRNPSGACDHLYWPDNLTDEAKRANGYVQVQTTIWTKSES